MNKKEIQKRVLKDGNPLALSNFNWDEETKTFSSNERNLVIDFANIYSATIKAGDYATIKAGDYATIKAGGSATIDAGYSATIKAGGSATIDAGYSATIKAGDYATIDTGNYATIDAGNYATIKAGDYATIKAGGSATIDAGYSATIEAGYECVIVRRDLFQVIQPQENEVIKTYPCNIKGYISKREGEQAFYINTKKSRIEHIIVDGILSRVVSKRKGVYKVINHGQDKETYLIEREGIYSHGDTLKEAKESLIYKISDRDTSQYNSMGLDTVLTLEEGVKMYRKITGACEGATRDFVNGLEKQDKYSIAEIIEITEGQYNNDKLKEFFR